jgi:hypothetical protein
VSGVPQDRILRGFKYSVQRERQLDGAKVRSEVATRFGDGVDYEATNLVGQLGELRARQTSEVTGLRDVGERHGSPRYLRYNAG